ncbi:MAG: DUF4091 domain-containing protein [Ruminococcaceae bacterium]|nr:DUF4091 domain-containing protein [Oscillospiraceae bacterium]
MNFDFAIMPETYKLTVGTLNNFAPYMIKDYAKSISLISAGNSTAAFQILVTADERYTLNLGNAPYFAQKHRPTVRAEVKCDFEVSLNHQSLLCDDDRCMKADILTADPIKELEDGSAHALYAEIRVPKGTKAGKYPISLRFYESEMFSEERLIAQTEIELEVFAYDMPDMKDSPFFLDLWQHNCNIARKHGCEPFSDRHFEVMDKYLATMAALGQKTVTLILSDTPWSGQWCHLETRNEANLYEYSIVKIYREKDGCFYYDFSAAQRYIDLCAKHNIYGEISLYGLVNVWCDYLGGFDSITPDHPDGLKLRYYDRAEGVYRYITRGEDVDAYIKAVHDYFVETEQIDRVRVVADEPADTAAYRRITDHIKSIAPKFVFKAAINHSEFIPEFADTVGDYVPSLLSLSSEFDKILEYKQSMKDSRFTWYVCNNPHHPNIMLCNDLCEGLLIGVLTSYLEMDGFLRWNYTVWTDHPKEDIRYFGWPAGDLCFVYPGEDSNPLLSLRYKTLYRAIEICILLNEYKKKKDAKPLYDRVIFTKDVREFFSDNEIIARDKLCSVDYSDYEYIRRTCLEELGI